MKSILIVDDIKVNLKILEVLLTRNGYNTTSAISGKDALSLLQIKPIDLIISDILMPEMDGFQFCRLCKLDENLQHIPFVFYSSTHTEAKARKLARKVGAQAFIIKPADPAMLLKTINEILDSNDPRLSTHNQPNQNEPEIRYSEQLIDTLETQNAALTQREHSCAALLKNIPCTVWTVDAGGNIAYISSAVEGITGFSIDHIIKTGKRAWLTRVHPSHAEKVKTAYKNLYKHQIPLDIEYLFECQDGDVIWLHEKSGSPYTKKGKRYADGVSIDISEKKYIQAHQMKFRESQAIKSFTGGVAHDLNNLLTGIAGYIELSCMASTTPSEQNRFLTNALRISTSASELTRSFFAISSDRKPAKDTLLGDVVSKATHSVLGNNNALAKLEIPKDLWPCRVDTAQMTQAMENMLLNAKEALPMDGFIEVILQNVSIENREFISDIIMSPGHYVKTTIRDNGRGIETKDLHHIFHPYFTTKMRDIKRGVGLGLSLSEAIITRHDGVIAVNSRKGMGTTMDIYLPAQKPGAPPAMGSSRIYPPQAGKLLVMDADEMVRDITWQVLERAGFKVTCVKTGTDAVKSYRQAMETECPFSVVILDLMTDEDEMTGISTLEQLKKLNPDVQAIVSSGYPSDPVIMQYKQYGFHATVSKPYITGDLVASINELLSS
ncbi:MAG: response regulator [Desulfobacterium sp.]